MEWIALFFLALSIYLYCLLGGADFGVGVHELIIPRRQKRAHEEVVKVAMGPVWEANHMWLIIVIVILFVGFPRIYSEISIHLHIPMMLMLIGIILRGCAFSFRHYDIVEDDSRKWYSLVFSLSSLLTPVMFGMIIGALLLGRIQPQPGDYLATYVAPWLNLFSFCTGLFVLSIFAFIAAIFMIGEETIGEFRDPYIVRARWFHLIMIAAGGLVFVSAQMRDLNLIGAFTKNFVAIAAFVLATASHALLWHFLQTRKAWMLRILAGFQLLMIVAAWLAITFPNVLTYADGTGLSLLEQAAPSGTLLMLALALIVGSVIFLPLLIYLFFVFKRPLAPRT